MNPNTHDLIKLRRELETGFNLRTASPGTDPIKQELIPSTGQCAAVAWIVNQRFGGQFVSTKINGQSHWFNRLNVWQESASVCATRDVDLTGDQFGFPPINVGLPGELYPETQVRQISELNVETVQRAKTLQEQMECS